MRRDIITALCGLVAVLSALLALTLGYSLSLRVTGEVLPLLVAAGVGGVIGGLTGAILMYFWLLRNSDDDGGQPEPAEPEPDEPEIKVLPARAERLRLPAATDVH